MVYMGTSSLLLEDEFYFWNTETDEVTWDFEATRCFSNRKAENVSVVSLVFMLIQLSFKDMVWERQKTDIHCLCFA